MSTPGRQKGNGDGASPIDPVEAELMREVARRRADLTARAESFSAAVRTTLDPRPGVKRHLGRGLIASVATGVALGLFPSLRGPGKETEPGTSQVSARGIAGDILRNFGPPFLSGILSGFLRR